MTVSAARHIPPEVRRILDNAGVPWSAEFCRSSVRLRVAGRVCQTFPMVRGRIEPGHFMKNALAAVNRAVRQVDEQRS